MMLVGDVIDPIRLLFAIRETPVDVVIVTPLKPNGEPKICRYLLAENPELRVLILSANGEFVYLYQREAPQIRIEKPSVDTIIEIIRNSQKNKFLIPV
jgi:hypothetical protein